MDYYDVVSDSCSIDRELEKTLGYKRIIVLNKEIKLENIDSNKKLTEGKNIVIGINDARLYAAVKSGAKALIMPDSVIRKKLLEGMSEKRAILCLPLGLIVSSTGLGRSKLVYRMSRLFSYARKSTVEVSFITLAKSNLELLSSLQLIELAKFVGASEEYARYSLSKINKNLIKT